jgi:hypothetical protein
MKAMKRTRFGWAIGLGLLVLASAGCPSGTGDGNGDGVQPGVEIAIPNEGAQHVPVGEQVTYVANPPASGSHWSAGGIAPVAAGFYETAVEEEQWVHNLEHGYVVILYDCAGACSAALLEELQDFFDSAPPGAVFGNTKLVIAPYEGLPFLLTAVAWDRQLHLEDFDEATLLDFYGTYVDQGPELVP